MRHLEREEQAPVIRPPRERLYLRELDPIRVVTAFCVIGVHVTASTLIFYRSAAGIELQSAVTSGLHFTRQIFLTLTAFVLTYNYAHRRFAPWSFWRKRGVGLLLPYTFWSLSYVWIALPHQPLGKWLGAAAYDTLTGRAAYQMYYILLTLELYLVLPLVLWFRQRFERQPWMVLGTSFVVQLVLMYLDYHFIQYGPLAQTGFGRWAREYHDRLLFMYQFAILLGGMAALHVEQVRAFVVRHGGWMITALILGLGVHWLHYVSVVVRCPRSLDYATAPLQPTMVVYQLGVTLFLYWLACRWADHHANSGSPPPAYVFWKAVANASFGIYLIHVFILSNFVLPTVAPRLPGALPAGVRVAFIWLAVAVISTGMSLALLYTPGLSRLMGRACILPSGSVPMRALDGARLWINGQVVKQLTVVRTKRYWGGARRVWGIAFLVALLNAALMARWSIASASVSGATTRSQGQPAFAGSVVHGSTPTSATPGTFTTEHFTSDQGLSMTYYLYVPAQAQPRHTYPVVLLLHGIGEDAAVGEPPEASRNRLLQQPYVQAWVTTSAQAQYPCFVVVPQVVTGTRWVTAEVGEGSYTQPAQPTAALNAAMDIVLIVEAEYSKIDLHRLYIVGISMGAYGVWDAIERWPSLFAAAAPLAGGGDPAHAAAAVRLPIWEFHGAADAHELIANAREMYAAIHAAGGTSCSTEVPGLGHDLWNTIQVFQNTTFRAWLFSQTNAVRGGERPVACTTLSVDGLPTR